MVLASSLQATTAHANEIERTLLAEAHLKHAKPKVIQLDTRGLRIRWEWDRERPGLAAPGYFLAGVYVPRGAHVGFRLEVRF